MPLFISAYQQVGPAKSDARKWLRERKNGASKRVDSCAVNFIKFRLADLRRCSKRVEYVGGCGVAERKLIDCQLYLHIFFVLH